VGQKSSIDRLPEPVREAINAEINAGRATLDEILDKVREEFGDEQAPSRSALGRHRKKIEEQIRDIRESREIADVVTDKLGHDPNSDIGKFAIEIMRTLAYRAGADMLDLSREGPVDTKELSQLARMMKYV